MHLKPATLLFSYKLRGFGLLILLCLVELVEDDTDEQVEKEERADQYEANVVVGHPYISVSFWSLHRVSLHTTITMLSTWFSVLPSYDWNIMSGHPSSELTINKVIIASTTLS